MNTPKTDAACGWPWGHHGRIESSDLRWSPDGPFVHSEVAREIERENAALAEENRRLHVELDAYHNGEQLRVLRAENAGLRGALEESQEYGRNHANAVMKLLSVISRIRFAVDSQPQRSQAMRLKDVGDLCDEVLGKKASP